MKTRGKSSTKTSAKSSTKAAAEAVAATATTAPRFTLEPESTNPPKLFILPDDVSSEARFVNLASPRTSLQARYLCCPKNGFYEVTKVGAPKTDPRSLLLSPLEPDKEEKKSPNSNTPRRQLSDGEYDVSLGYVTKTADIFVTTPIDPLFLILPALAAPPSSKSSERTKRLFLASEDYLDVLISNSPHFRSLLRVESTRRLIESRMAAVCDTVDAGDETMYRLSEERLLQELLRKAKKMAAVGLPASMEEKLVRKALEAPLLCLKRGESSMNELAEEEETSNPSGTLTPATDGVDSQATAPSTETPVTSASSASTAAASFSESCDPSTTATTLQTASTPIDAPEGVPHLLRLRTALAFIMASYIPPYLETSLDTLLASPSPSNPDFTPLIQHLAHLAHLRKQQLEARSFTNFSRKRALDEDESGGSRAEKKRKEEERRKKPSESRAVRDLKKVNVSGMKKMSDFFKKK